MSLWPILALMTIVLLALVLWPLLRRPPAVAARGEHDLSVYRAQLGELARDERTGMLGPDEARAARLEIERRMLAADPAAHAAPGRALGSERRRLLAAVLALALPGFALALYGELGRPELPAMPFAGRPQPAGAVAEAAGGAGAGTALPPVETMLARLEERVADAPDDLEGWLRLGRAYALSALPAKAAEAYERAAGLDAADAEIQAALGEARIEAAGGVVTAKARAALERALELDPANPRARFYQGQALLQRGERRPALDVWAALVADTPADAPYLPMLRERVTALAEDLGLEVAAVLPAPAPPAGPAPPADSAQAEARAPAGAIQTQRGPSAEQMRELQSRPPEEQAEMIRGMVAGLAARLEQQPDDVEGWRMLARSYRTLGESAQAAEAAQQVARLLPDDAAAQIDYGEALLALHDAEQPLTPALVEQWRRIAELDEGNPQALFVLGRAAAEVGEDARARELWQRLLDRMPADAPQRAQLQGLLDQLSPGG
jgi:cytochrome c-type biogenesis protein CcmH